MISEFSDCTDISAAWDVVLTKHRESIIETIEKIGSIRPLKASSCVNFGFDVIFLERVVDIIFDILIIFVMLDLI